MKTLERRRARRTIPTEALAVVLGLASLAAVLLPFATLLRERPGVVTMCCGPELTLSRADHATPIVEAPVLTVAQTAVLLDGRQMTDTRALESEDPAAIDDSLRTLFLDLQTLDRSWTTLHPNLPLPSP